jgi:hypothetical protein
MRVQTLVRNDILHFKGNAPLELGVEEIRISHVPGI